MGSFDDVLNIIGQFGRFQIFLFFFIPAAYISTGWHTAAIVFIGASRRHWCHVTGLENFTEAEKLSLIEPVSCGEGIPDSVCKQCYANDFNYSSFSQSTLSSWNRSLQLNSSTSVRKCDAFEFNSEEFESTIVNQYGLVCDREWMVSMLQTVYMAGYLCGCLLFGSISDRFGRMVAFLLALALEIIFSIVGIYLPYYSLFAICRFLLGSTAGAVYTIGYVIVLELTGPKYRTLAGVFAQWGFDVGVLLCIAVGYTVKDHIMMQWIFAIPPVIFFITKWIIPESPRWLVTKDRLDEAEVFLRKVGKVNGRKLPDNIKLSGFIDKQLDQSNATVADLFKTPNLRRRSFISFYVWFSSSAVYYGLMLGSRGFGFSIYTNVAQTGAAAILAYFLCTLLFNKIGRRIGIMASLVCAGIALFVCIPLVNLPNLAPLLFTISFLGRIANSSGFHGCYLHTSEFYPTVVRNVGVGCGSLFARVGGLVAPQLARLVVIWQPLPAIILGVIAISAGLLTLLLPETLNKQLPETIEDGEKFGTKQRSEEDREQGNPLKEIQNVDL